MKDLVFGNQTMIIEKIVPKRNVIDRYKYYSNLEIKEDLNKKRHNFGVLCSNLGYDFNISGVIRSANAFLAREIIIYGPKKYDRRGAVGTNHYENFRYVKYTEQLDAILREYDIIIGLENGVPNSSDLRDYEWNINKKTLICVGQEDAGLPQDIIKRCHDILTIQQFGSVRSLNVASAASICFYEYCRSIKE